MPQPLKCPTCNAPVPYDAEANTTVVCPFCGASIPTPADWQTLNPAGITPDATGNPVENALQMATRLKHVVELARAGNQIEAIREYRALTGLGLKESKDAVEQMAAGHAVIQLQSSTEISSDSAGNAEEWAAMQAHVRSGNKLEAIKIFRTLTGASLQEAKATVEQMAANREVQFTALAADLSAGGTRDATTLAVQSLLGMGKKIEAIKVYRQLTGASLQEAKNAVEAMESGSSLANAPAAATPTFSIPASSQLTYPQSPSVVGPENTGNRSCLIWGVIAIVLLFILGAAAAGIIFFAVLSR